MADDNPVANNHNDVRENSAPMENGVENDAVQNGLDTPEAEENGSLRDFVTRNFHNQRVSGAAGEMSAEDEERRNNFFQRAIGESQRMSAEVARYQRRHDELKAELGAENLHAWTMEHASQVTVTLPGPSQLQTHPGPELQEPTCMDCDK